MVENELKPILFNFTTTFSLFIFVIIITVAYCFNPQTCKSCTCPGRIKVLDIKEHCDEQCGKENFGVEEGDEVNLTCFSCDNDGKQLNWTYNRNKINADIFPKNANNDHSESQLKFKLTNFNESGTIKCKIVGTNHTATREYYLCDKFPKPKLKCEAYSSAHDWRKISLGCNVTIDENFTKKNQHVCDYQIITESNFTNDAINTFTDTCFPNCQMKTINFPFLTDVFPLKIITKSDAKNTTHDLTIPRSYFRKIYRHNGEPVFNKSNDERCLISMTNNIPLGLLDFRENIKFDYRINIKDANRIVNTDNFTIDNDENFWVPRYSALKANRNYSIEISYNLNDSEIISGPRYIQCQTQKSLPKVSVNISRGSYIQDHDEWFIFWKPVPEEDFSGSSLRYIIFYENEQNFTKESYLKLSSNKFSKENMSSTVMINCKNEIGFGPQNKTLKIHTDLTTTPKTSVIITGGRSVVQWSLVSDATSYVVFWCSTNYWTNCNGGINWQNVNENKTFLEIITNNSNYVFGVSTCYNEDKCSKIKEASNHTNYEPRILENSIKVHDVFNDSVLIEWSIDETSNYNNFVEFFHVIVRLNSKPGDYLRINTANSSVRLFCKELADRETILISLIPFSKMYNTGRNHNGSVSSLTKTVQCRLAKNFTPIIGFSAGSIVLVLCVLCSILTYMLCKRINKQKLDGPTEYWTVHSDYEDDSHILKLEDIPFPAAPKSPIPTLFPNNVIQGQDLPNKLSNNEPENDRNAILAATYRRSIDYSENGNQDVTEEVATDKNYSGYQVCTLEIQNSENPETSKNKHNGSSNQHENGLLKL